MSNRIYFIVIPVILSAGLILVLLAIAENREEKINGFSRVIIHGIIKSSETIDIKYQNYYIAGAGETTVYLANTTAYGLLLKVSHKTADTGSLFMKLPADIMLNTGRITTFVNDTTIMMIDNITPKVLVGNTVTVTLAPAGNLSTACVDPVPITNARIAAKIYDTTRKQTDLAIVNDIRMQPANALVKKIDGKFCTDGRLLRDNVTSDLAYIYFYRNQYITLDSNLRVQSNGHTIDTITQSSFSLGAIYQGKGVTFASPPRLVNRWAALSDGKLFVHSNTRADNEKISDFNRNDVIDVYDISSDQYIYSFYIPHGADKAIRQFSVYKNILFALSGTTLRIIHLDLIK